MDFSATGAGPSNPWLCFGRGTTGFFSKLERAGPVSSAYSIPSEVDLVGRYASDNRDPNHDLTDGPEPAIQTRRGVSYFDHDAHIGKMKRGAYL